MRVALKMSRRGWTELKYIPDVPERWIWWIPSIFPSFHRYFRTCTLKERVYAKKKDKNTMRDLILVKIWAPNSFWALSNLNLKSVSKNRIYWVPGAASQILPDPAKSSPRYAKSNTRARRFSVAPYWPRRRKTAAISWVFNIFQQFLIFWKGMHLYCRFPVFLSHFGSWGSPGGAKHAPRGEILGIPEFSRLNWHNK